MLKQLHLFKFANIFKISLIPAFSVSQKKLNTQVFSDLTWGQLATPQHTKKLIVMPIHMHSRVSQKSLYHRKRVRHRVKTCFSQKKTKVFKKVNKVKRYFYSQILKRDVFVTASMHAVRCIRKAGSFDNYILTTKPKYLDSKFGQYLREIMMRKINDSSFRIPYIIGQNRTIPLKAYKKYSFQRSINKLKIPKQYKDSFRTLQRRFGSRPEQLNQQDYKKYLELESLKQKLGKQLDPAHPLLLELRQKMSLEPPKEQWQKIQKLSKQTEQKFLAKPDYQQYRKMRVQQAKKQIQMMQTKIREMSIDSQQFDQ